MIFVCVASVCKHNCYWQRWFKSFFFEILCICVALREREMVGIDEILCVCVVRERKRDWKSKKERM